MDRISVITTVKNGEEFIIGALETVQSQSYQYVEHIIYNDGSSDNTSDIVNNYMSRNDTNNIVLYNSKPVGRGNALNNAIKMSTQKWVAILDVDDRWHPDKLKYQMDIIKKHKLKVLATNSKIIFNQDMVDDTEYSNVDNIFPITLVSMLYKNRINHSSVLIERELAKYDESRSSQYDYELWLRLLTNNIKINTTYDIYTYHTIHKKQSYENGNKKYFINSYKLKIKYIKINKKYIYAALSTIVLIYQILLPKKVRMKILLMKYNE